MKKQLLMLLFATSILFGCEASSIKNGRIAYKKYFNKVLKDPHSLVIYNERAEEWGPAKAKFDLDYGAKNELGGTVRRVITVYTTGDALLEILEGDQKGFYILDNSASSGAGDVQAEPQKPAVDTSAHPEIPLVLRKPDK
ncbi:hypothetical protein [Pedobacter caeni]|uniref:Uncharacterized protein n=1 Tax=Pedobacter caeni TaxID=288992 RepID=A0A1M5F3R6_9SPHI|nr:hypothetical protein [Pedobacter caeni]SHF86183.1 hypothetical protein SAMN04488522_103923 [Pedobacter caeni]